MNYFKYLILGIKETILSIKDIQLTYEHLTLNYKGNNLMTSYLFCKDCKWYEQRPNKGSLEQPALCKNPQLGFNLVNGETKTTSCENSRTSGIFCGYNGDWFEARV